MMITPKIKEKILELVLYNDCSGHPEILKTVKDMRENGKLRTLSSNIEFSGSRRESNSSILDSYTSNGTFEKPEMIHTFGKASQNLNRNKSRKKLDESADKNPESESTSKYSISDKENHLDIRAIIPSKS